MRKQYTKEQIISESKKYNSITEFYSKDMLLYRASQRRGKQFFFEITKHMSKKGNGTEKMYMDEFIIEKGNECKSPSDFKKKFPNLYERATNRKLLVKITYKDGYKKYESYDEDTLLKKCSEYDSPVSLINQNYKLYCAAQRKDLLQKIEYKKGRLGHKYKRMVYVYEFPDNHFYCGLTYNESKRHQEHINDWSNTSVGKHIRKTGLIPVKKIISDGYIDSREAGKLEESTRLYYIKNGWSSLNVKPCGALGSNKIIWTKEKIYDKIKNINSRKELHKSGIYVAAKKLGIEKEITKHLPYDFSKQIVLDYETGIFYIGIQQAYKISNLKLAPDTFRKYVKTKPFRFKIV
jgi:predicted GIY-YIG superfamily endonuclease